MRRERLSDRVEWPGKENQAAQPKGYVYIIFESEKEVRELLRACTIHDGNDANAGNYYYKISSKRIRAKEVSPQLAVAFVRRLITVTISLGLVSGRSDSVDNCRLELRRADVAETGSR